MTIINECTKSSEHEHLWKNFVPIYFSNINKNPNVLFFPLRAPEAETDTA